MSARLNQINSLTQSPELHGSQVLHQVLGKNRMNQTRREIGLIADHSFAEGVISKAAYKGYRELAEGSGAHNEDKFTAEMLENTRKFAKEHEVEAIAIHRRIKLAIGQKIASKVDEKFLMEKLIWTNHNFVGQAEQIGALVDQKLEHMRRERDRYDALANHKLIKDIGYLKVDGNNRIDFPKEDEFLAMTVIQRRELLDKLEAMLTKAEANATITEENEDGKLVDKYEAKLLKAVAEGIIGEHTYKSFSNGFKKIDHDEKEIWYKEFETRMQRYRELWSQIGDTLQGPALEKMEGMLHDPEAGYTELFKAFGKLKNSESARLVTSYVEALEEYRQEGVIGSHSIAKFLLWMGDQELDEQYGAEEILPRQMKRYQELWQKADELPKKQQEYLKSRIDDWGYTELNEQYEKFASGEEIDDDEESFEENISRIRSGTVKDAIVETADKLEAQGSEKRSAFMQLLDRVFRRTNRDTFDATNFEAKVRERADEEEPGKEQGTRRVKEEQGFVEVESTANNETARQTRVAINDEKGVEKLLNENVQHNYRGEEIGGNDSMTLAVNSTTGPVELELNEVRVLQEHLKKKEAANDNSKRKAA